jgi:hypothetical protein
MMMILGEWVVLRLNWQKMNLFHCAIVELVALLSREVGLNCLRKTRKYANKATNNVTGSIIAP